MGQQQLLLVILVTILVGIATVVAINVFGSAAEEANRDAVRQDILIGAAAAQGLHARPTMLNGAGRDFTNLNLDADDDLLARLGMPVIEDFGDCAWGNDNGCYTVSGILANQFTITGEPASGGDDIVADVVFDPAATGGTPPWTVVWDGTPVGDE